MKGIVVEKNNEKAVLLLSDGTFKTVETSEELEIGSVLFINEVAQKRKYFGKRIGGMIAAVFIVVFMGSGVFAWAVPVQYINIDINPSVELSVNRFDRIIMVSSLNCDGRELVESVSLQAKRFESGIEIVMDEAKEKGYLEDEEDVLISISSSDEKRTEKTMSEIRENVSTSVEILTFDTDERNSAVDEGLSPGKKSIIEKVMESGTDLDTEELADASVKELMQKVKTNRKQKETEKEEREKSKNQEKNQNASEILNRKTGENSMKNQNKQGNGVENSNQSSEQGGQGEHAKGGEESENIGNQDELKSSKPKASNGNKNKNGIGDDGNSSARQLDAEENNRKSGNGKNDTDWDKNTDRSAGKKDKISDAKNRYERSGNNKMK